MRPYSDSLHRPMAAEHVSLGDLYVLFTVLWSVPCGLVAAWRSRWDMLTALRYFPAAAGVAAMLGAWFAVAVWLAARWHI